MIHSTVFCNSHFGLPTASSVRTDRLAAPVVVSTATRARRRRRRRRRRTRDFPFGGGGPALTVGHLKTVYDFNKRTTFRLNPKSRIRRF